MPSFNVQIDLEAPIRPTESINKVKAAIKNLFPDSVFDDVSDGTLRATAKSLNIFKERLGAQAIRAASRRVLRRGLRPGHIIFSLAKQAAFVNRVNFGVDGPLGDITVLIRTETPEAVIDKLTDKHDYDLPEGRPVGKRPPTDEYLVDPED